MIDFEHVVLIAKSRGVTRNELAAELGISPGHLWRLETGRNRPSKEVLARALTFLNMRRSDVDRSANGEWTRFHTTRLDLLADFHEEMKHAESVLTVTCSAESYLQDEWMLDWSNRIWLSIRDWDEHKKALFPYAKQLVAARDHSDFVHRIVCPWELFLAARAQCVDWLDQVRHALGAFEDMTAVMPVRSWDRVYARCSEQLPSESAGWNKLCIVDSLRALIHVDQQWYLTSSNERMIRNLKGAIDTILSTEEPGFLRESQIRLSSMRDAAQQTEDAIESVLRSGDDLERAELNARAFVRMIVEEAHVPPRCFIARPPDFAVVHRPISDRILRTLTASDRSSEASTEPSTACNLPPPDTGVLSHRER